MLSPVQLKLSAAQDLAEGYAWYETRQAGLGDEFLAAVGRCVDSIARHPLANAIVMKDFRRALVRRFPYSVYYKIEPQEIVVRGIFHNSRKPSLWRKRLRQD